MLTDNSIHMVIIGLVQRELDAAIQDQVIAEANLAAERARQQVYQHYERLESVGTFSIAPPDATRFQERASKTARDRADWEQILKVTLEKFV